MENTRKNKQRFFALYFGQNVFKDGYGLSHVDGHILNVSDSSVKEDKIWIKKSYLELTPLSQITDEDALAAYRFHYPLEKWEDKEERDAYDTKEAVEWLFNYGKPNYIKLTIDGADYLRSNGYALPYLGISVEQQIEWGWIKLKEK